MRRTGFVLLLLLAGCSGTQSQLSVAQPGLDVARAALRGGSPRVALQVADGLLSHNPSDKAALIVQGDALTTLGRLEDATKSYTTVLALDPTSVDGHIGLGRIRLATDPAGAEALFLEALQRDPRNTTALNDLGIARDLQGHHTDAQRAYSQALGIDPDMHAAQVNLALSLAMSGHSGRAVRLLQPLASEPGASRKLRHDLAAVLAMGGKRAEAERILSADLSPEEVQQALQDYVAARAGGSPATALLAGTHARPAVPAGTHAGPAVATGTHVRPAVPAGTHANPGLPAVVPSHHHGGPGFQVQFAASPSKADAQAEWQRLQARMPRLLAGREPIFAAVTQDGGTFWRLRTDGFATVPDAETFCAQVRNAGGSCVVENAPDQGSKAPLPQRTNPDNGA